MAALSQEKLCNQVGHCKHVLDDYWPRSYALQHCTYFELLLFWQLLQYLIGMMRFENARPSLIDFLRQGNYQLAFAYTPVALLHIDRIVECFPEERDLILSSNSCMLRPQLYFQTVLRLSSWELGEKRYCTWSLDPLIDNTTAVNVLIAPVARLTFHRLGGHDTASIRKGCHQENRKTAKEQVSSRGVCGKVVVSERVRGYCQRQ